MTRLFTTFYSERKPARRAEYQECLHRNLTAPEVSEVLVLCECAEEFLPAHPKLRVRAVSRRPNYDLFFEWLNELAGENDVSVLSNTDIWFDSSLGAAQRFLGPRDCFAMARWDGDTLYDHNDSQDCWIFRGPVTGVRGDFPTGVARCDNRMLYELQAAGYRVRNPAFSIRAHHIHSGTRVPYPGANLPHFVDPPYRYLWPHNLCSLPATICHNLKYPRNRIGWRFDRRKAAGWLPVRAAKKLVRLVRKRATSS